MINEEGQPDNEFERVEQIVKIEVELQPQLHTPHIKKYLTPLNQQEIQETVDSNKIQDLLQANPILPPGKHHVKEEPQFRLKYMNLRDKFNQTSFTNSSLTPRHPRLPPNSAHLSHIEQNYSPQEADQFQEEDPELKALLLTKSQVYRRFNNSKLNVLGRQRVMCSVFVDWRKQKITCKEIPAFQRLAQIKKIPSNRSHPDWLTFNSSFESGNLLLVLSSQQKNIPTYDLYMQNDMNTKGCTQWFYFSVVSRARGKARFRLMNFYKPTSLYQKGMKVLCSQDTFEWRRTGTAITYGKTEQGKNFYALEFIHEFDLSGKITYFAYGYPYTYSLHLSNYIDGLLSDQRYNKMIHRTNLCLSAMGNSVPLLSISSPNNNKRDPKPLIYIIGRQHPGETPSSFIVQGLINFLLSLSLQARELREKYQFRVVPMVNIDGVISGNYRSNLSGSDVNRQWQFPSKRLQPQIFWLKQQIGVNRKQVAFFLDIHAHSRKMNSFFYGSKAAERDSKLFPFVCSKLNKFVSYSESSFTDDPSKRTTARVVLQHQFQIPHSLTFQASFYGWHDDDKNTNYSFKQHDLRQIGQSLGIGFYYSLIGIEKIKENKNGALPKCSSQKEKVLQKNSLKMLEKWNKQKQKQNSQKQLDQIYSEGSSLDPQHFQLKEEQLQLIEEMNKLQIEKDVLSLKRNLSSPKDKDSTPKNRYLIYSTLSPDNDSKLLAPKTDSPNRQNLRISKNQFQQISSIDKKKLFSVRELELELQTDQKLPEKKLRGIKFKMGNGNIDRYQSLDINRNERARNYKEEVLQMKKALKYLLQTKSSDYEHYKSCFKSFTHENMSTSLYRNDKRYYQL